MRRAALVAVLAATVALGSCTTGTDPGSQAVTQVGSQVGSATATPPAAPSGPELLEGMRDGVWPVAEAGEIEFDLAPRGLDLVAVRPAPGWQVVDEEVGPAEIEVDLRADDVRATVEVGYQHGVLEIEVDQLLDPPPDGPLQLGPAGSVELLVEGDRVRVGEVTLQPPWRETRRSEHAGDAELGLERVRTGAVETWEVHAWLDDGDLEVATDYEIQGLASP